MLLSLLLTVTVFEMEFYEILRNMFVLHSKLHKWKPTSFGSCRDVSFLARFIFLTLLQDSMSSGKLT